MATGNVEGRPQLDAGDAIACPLSQRADEALGRTTFAERGQRVGEGQRAPAVQERSPDLEEGRTRHGLAALASDHREGPEAVGLRQYGGPLGAMEKGHAGR